MKDKQIEEMTIALIESQHEFDKAWHECLHNNGKQPERENVFYAKYLVENKGYRLASDVAREIFELVECAFSPVLVYEGHTVKAYLAKLKKKYTEACDG